MTTSRPRALLLAAGLSTRLGSLSSERPKPLMPVCDQPLLRYAIALLRGHGITELAINLHHLGQQIVDELGDGSGLGVSIHYSWEEEILGTGGGIKRLQSYLTRDGRAPFFVVNGKILIDVDLDAVLALHERTDAVATMVIRRTPDAERWGAIDSEGDRVVGMLGRGRKVAERSMFTGVHVVGPRLVELLPDGVSDSIRQGYVPLLEAGAPIAAFHLQGYFHEHSTPRRYLDGNLNALRGLATIRHRPGPFVGVDDSATVAPSASVDARSLVGARASVGADSALAESVVGRDATVAPGSVLERVVVWPGARVSGRVTDSIVTPTQVIAANDQDA